MASVQLVRDDLDRTVDLMEVGHHAIKGLVESGLVRALWREVATTTRRWRRSARWRHRKRAVQVPGEEGLGASGSVQLLGPQRHGRLPVVACAAREGESAARVLGSLPVGLRGGGRRAALGAALPCAG